jgi:stage II sporulation protein GA (sporulation sigma-E factor processing peptidase)
MVTAQILRIPFNRWRILSASALGGIYSLSIFITSLNPIITIAIKLAMSSSIILAAFKMKNIKSFIRAFAAFFGANFIFAGLMLALWIAVKPKGMVFNNGTVYFNINMALLCVSVIISYTLITIALKLLKRKAPSNKIFITDIEAFGRKR